MLPLTGKCFCCTAISSEARDTVERQVVELGGTYTLDLMSHTTHLVVGDTRTAKYRYCVRHRDDVKILQPTAIGQFYEAWRRGRGDTTTIVPAASPSLDSFVLPTFYGLAICVGHFRSDSIYDLNGDNTSPAAVRALIERHGGTATDSLTNAHAMLLSNIPTGKRYTKAVEWRLPVVHPLYVLDSLRRGASLDPDDYAYDHYPEIPRNSDAPTSGGDPPSMAVSAAAAVARTDSAPAKIRKNLDVWNSLVHREHTTTSGGSHSTTTDAMISDSFNANIDMLVVNINIFKQRLPESLFERPELVECAYNSISRVSTKNKIVAAKKWKIPVVSPWYLFELANDSDPSIKDLKWCLYYSKKQEPDSGSDSLRLPSPKKIRRRFGKLVTNSKELELQTSKTHEDSNDEDEVRIGYDSKRQKK
ncbi:protein kinase activating protein dpb11 [Yamadazyma tenuis]|uniref:protein kinase activating protein dpb11 n=1 Tax=Candida tenuis TaxID=2315449 RepID=UPI0027AA9A68|nr:protein kinase activating protein dpb11 [Yamadazyma tenuis]